MHSVVGRRGRGKLTREGCSLSCSEERVLQPRANHRLDREEGACTHLDVGTEASGAVLQAAAQAIMERDHDLTRWVAASESRLCFCLEDCPARFGCNVKASASTFLSIKTMVGAGRKHSFFTTAEAAAFSRKLASTTAPDHRVHQKLDTIERAVGGMKNKFLDIKARRNGVAFESQFAFTASSAVLSRPL